MGFVAFSISYHVTNDVNSVTALHTYNGEIAPFSVHLPLLRA